MRRRMLWLILALILVVSGVACGPESSRRRGGGAGADIGNRTTSVELHGEQAGDRAMYRDTPVKIRTD